MSNQKRRGNFHFFFGLLLLACVLSATAATLSLAWNKSPNPWVAGYRIYYGTSPRNYPNRVDAGTNLSVTLSNLQPGGVYYAVAVSYDTNGNQSIFSNEITNRVPASPVVVKQPLSVTEDSGAPLTLIVGATGDAPLSFQWFLGSIPIPNATNAVMSMEPGISGSYTATICNAFGCATSAVAVVTMVSASSNAPPPMAVLTPPVRKAPAKTFEPLKGTAPVKILAPPPTLLPESSPDVSPAVSAIVTTPSVVTQAVARVVTPLPAPAATPIVAPPPAPVVAPTVAAPPPQAARMTVTPLPASVIAPLVTPLPPPVAPRMVAKTLPPVTPLPASVAGPIVTPLPMPVTTPIVTPSPFPAKAPAAPPAPVATPVPTPVVSPVATPTVKLTAAPVMPAGPYNGLFFPTNGATEETAGMLENCVIRADGEFMGKFYIKGKYYPVKGALDASGNATNVIQRQGVNLSSLSLTMHLDLTGGTRQITGLVSNISLTEPWTAPLAADLAYSSVNTNWSMTLSSSPAGHAVANTVDSVVRVSCVLGDKTKFSQTSPLSRDGYFPLCAKLPGHGLIEGWVNFSSGAPTGTVAWVHGGATEILHVSGAMAPR